MLGKKKKIEAEKPVKKKDKQSVVNAEYQRYIERLIVRAQKEMGIKIKKIDWEIE